MVLLLNSSLGNEVAELALQVKSLFHIEFGSQLTGEGLQVLKDCEHVTEVSLIGCTLLTSDDFRLFGRHSKTQPAFGRSDPHRCHGRRAFGEDSQFENPARSTISMTAVH